MPLQQSFAEGHFFVLHLILAEYPQTQRPLRNIAEMWRAAGRTSRADLCYRMTWTGARRSRMGSGLK
jgi:hypothetical protein